MNALRLTASTFGFLAGLGGLRHGVGEVLQGNVPPDGIIIESWTEGPFATNMGGEPGMTVVPNLFATGILAIAVSLIVLIWSVLFVGREHGGLGLILLSVAMLLFGGGFGPPIIGILAGVAGTRIGAPLPWWRSHLRWGVRSFLASLWPWVFGLSAVNGLLLFVGSIILVYSFDLNRPALFLYSFYVAALSVLLLIIVGIAHELQGRDRDTVAG